MAAYATPAYLCLSDIGQFRMRSKMTSTEVSKVYDTVLSIPGMNENVKLDLKVSRKMVLILTQVIERGLKEEKKEASWLLAAAGNEAASELSGLIHQCLEKAGLTELNAKLQQWAS